MAAYKGTTIAGFPNLFLLVGPNTGLGHTSVVFMIESQIGYVPRPRHGRQDGRWCWVDPGRDRTLQRRHQHDLEGTVWTPGGCTSWYLDEHGVNRTMWPGLHVRYWWATRRFDASEYAFLGMDVRDTPKHNMSYTAK